MAAVYSLEVRGTTFKYRSPTRDELEYIQGFSGGNLFEYFENLIKICVLEPAVSFEDKPGFINMDELPFLAGDIATLARTIEDASGFFGTPMTEYLAQQANAYAETEIGRLDALTLVTIPGTSLEQLKRMDPADVFKLYALAHVIAPAMGVDERIFLDPETWIKEQTAKSRQAKIDAKMRAAQDLLPQALRLGSSSSVSEETTYSVE